MLAPSFRRFSGLLMVSAACCGLLASAGNALATDSRALLETAEAACLDSAASEGWRSDRAKLVSSKALDVDRVELVFELTQDGLHTARLTCPYSLKEGVANTFTKRKAEVGADPAIPVHPSRLWWLLLPLTLGLGSWAWLRSHDASPGHAHASAGMTTNPEGDVGYEAEAVAASGLVEVREHADLGSRVLRQFRNGDTFQITGRRRRDAASGEWLELSKGGWVRDGETRYDRNIVR
ncbi:MAG: hypothetical protein ACK6AD_00935 [Cyanobacteriota bacterium]|jgi:hypothetical protein